jgi:hypothetical protein
MDVGALPWMDEVVAVRGSAVLSPTPRPITECPTTLPPSTTRPTTTKPPATRRPTLRRPNTRPTLRRPNTRPTTAHPNTKAPAQIQISPEGSMYPCCGWNSVCEQPDNTWRQAECGRCKSNCNGIFYSAPGVGTAMCGGISSPNNVTNIVIRRAVALGGDGTPALIVLKQPMIRYARP